MSETSSKRTMAQSDQLLMKRSTLASVSVASILIIVKFGAWLFTDSLALLSSLVDSMMDGLASAITFVAVRQAIKPADDEHRFGHGKWEALAGLSQAAFIMGSAVFLIFEAIDRLIRPEEIEQTVIGIGVMIFSIVLTAGLVMYQTRVVRQTNSLAINSDKLHYVGDLLMNAAVIVALILSGTMGIGWADPVFGIGIAIFIGSGAWEIAKNALDMLLDRELPDEDRDQIMAIIRANPRVQGFHDLRTRRSGPREFIQVHLEFHPEISLHDAHEIAEEVEKAITQAFLRAEVLIHQDPA